MNNLKEESEWAEKNQIYYYIFRNISFIACQFSIIVLTIMIINFINIIKEDPLDRERIENLIEKANQEPDNSEMTDFIRNIDLIARHSYFSSLSFNRFGTFLLSGGLVILILSLKITAIYRRKLPSNKKNTENDKNPSVKNSAFFSLTIASMILIISTLIFSYFLNVENQSHINFLKNTFTETEIKKLPLKEELTIQWPSLRGYNSLGISPHKNIPVYWNTKTDENIIWKTKIKLPGYNSPIIWKGKIFFTGADDDNKTVYCYNIENGQLFWEKNIISRVKKNPEVSEDTGLAASTMATNGLFVYAIFATGTIICLDFDGNINWQKELGVPENHYGHSSSLITYDKYIYIQFDHGRSAKLTALDYNTGKLKWKVKRDVDISWASPIIAEYKNRPVIIVNANPFVIPYNALNGKELWRNDCMSGEVGPSCAFSLIDGHGIVYAVNEYAKLAAIDMDSGKIIWEVMRNLPEASSPVVYENFLFLPTSWGALSCFNSLNGELYWMEEFDQGFYSSPVIADNKLYIIDLNGNMKIIELNTKFKLIAGPSLNGPVFTTPAFIDGGIIIKGQDFLYRIGIKRGTKRGTEE